MTNPLEHDDVQTILLDAERAATTAVRIMRVMLAGADAAASLALLDDVDSLFRLLDHADARAQLARTTAHAEDALEYAADARDLARAARDEARRRAHRAESANCAPTPVALDLVVIGSVPQAEA